MVKTIIGDGSVGSWNLSEYELKGPDGNGITRSISVTYNGYVYVMGGYDGILNISITKVYYAKLNSNGSLGPWNISAYDLLGERGRGINSSTAVTYNGYVYVMGGMDGDIGYFIKKVYYAKFNDNGSLGPWTTSVYELKGPTGNGIIYATSVVYNGYVYVMGGMDGESPTFITNVYYAKLNDNGSLDDWKISAYKLRGPDNKGIIYSTAVTYNGYIYVMGGTSSTYYGYYIKNVYYAKINEDGTLGDWTILLNKLIGPDGFGIIYATSVANNGYVYVMGGYDGLNVKSVYYTKLNENGSLGNWTILLNNLKGPSGNGIASSTAVTHNGYVYVMGGYDGTYVKKVYYAKLNTTVIEPITISYSPTSYIYTSNQQITPITTPVVLGVPGLTYKYTISPALPRGLYIDATSGTISGTPTESQSSIKYLIVLKDTTILQTTQATTQITITIERIITQPKPITTNLGVICCVFNPPEVM